MYFSVHFATTWTFARGDHITRPLPLVTPVVLNMRLLLCANEHVCVHACVFLCVYICKTVSLRV
jgi:hypothetical protein